MDVLCQFQADVLGVTGAARRDPGDDRARRGVPRGRRRRSLGLAGRGQRALERRRVVHARDAPTTNARRRAGAAWHRAVERSRSPGARGTATDAAETGVRASAKLADVRGLGRDVFGLLRRVRVDVLVARQLRDLVHHFVGELAQRQVVVRAARVARRVDRFAEPDRHPRGTASGMRESTGCTSSVADEPDRHDRHVAPQREARDAGVAAVQQAVARARALGVDAEDVARAQHVGRGRERALARASAFAPDRDLPAAAEEPRRLGIVEVLGLGHEGDAPAHDERDEDRIEERPVVRGKDHRTALGDVLPALDPDAHEHADERRDEGLDDPVQGPSGYAAIGIRPRARLGPTCAEATMRPATASTIAMVRATSSCSRRALSRARPDPSS